MANRQFSFGQTPTIRMSRSKFDLSFHHKTAFNVGDLVPFLVQEIYPGDTFKVDSTFVSRVSSSFLKPVVDNLFLDTYYFFVPNRLVMDEWSAVMGENKKSAWAPSNPTYVPYMISGSSLPVPNGTRINIPSNTVGDYMGLPTNVDLPDGINLLPFRAFALIYDEWFRDENNIDPMNILKTSGGSNTPELPNDLPWSSSNYTGRLPKVAKLHDYFTSALPAPQKGASVPISLGSQIPVVFPNSVDGEQWVYASGKSADLSGLPGTTTLSPLRWRQVLGSAPAFSVGARPILAATNTTDTTTGIYPSTSAGANDTTITLGNSVTPTNLALSTTGIFADPSNAQDTFNVNDLRFAFQLQKFLEKDARGGTRYIEFLKSHFGVNAPDYRLQRSEFLGGRRNPISIQQVSQTSQPTADSPLGAVGAFSLSSGSARYNKGFVEHGFVIGVMCIRQFHTYQQGVNKMWFRNSRYDYYDPLFANLGEQPVYTNELYVGSNANGSNLKGSVFGYNEAWADLRYKPSYVTGEMRSNATNSFDVWHFADNYSSAPTLSQQFIEETPTYVDRALSVPSSSESQFLVDIYCKQTAFRVMPTYSVPGLIDHH